ncbi:MAG: VCBS repeat-containing protein [Chitinophagales bacterium]
MKLNNIQKVIIFFAIILFISNCKNDKPASPQSKPNIEPSDLSGMELAKIHCASCHKFPEPSELEKSYWEKSALPQMAYRFGIYPKNERSTLIEDGVGGQLVESANIYPKEQTMALEDFEKIKKYYVENAPEKLVIAASEQLPSTNLFQLIEVKERFNPPMGTVIKSFPQKNRIIYSDAKEDYCSIEILDNKFKLIQSLAVPKPVSDIHFSGDTLVATSMGQFNPNDHPSGSIFKIFQKKGSSEYSGFFNELKGLQRPVFTIFSDLNQDKRADILVCEYGNHTGGLNWYENKGNRQYKRHVLLAQPGATQAIVHDFNKDNLPDIMALMAQGDEGIDIYFNLGGGKFERQRILRFSPLYGSVNIHLEDINKDGYSDILYINGDNADYSIVDKPYHGIHIFLNNGNNEFSEKYFYQLQGAYDAQLNDFDGDGDLDMAAISFFPRNNDSENGFVYLENISKSSSEFSFKAYSLLGTEKGRWIKMDVNDMNGDGKMDITLLSFTGMALTNDNKGQFEKWLKTSPSILHLQNRGK